MKCSSVFSGANFTISADSRNIASGVATGTNKKGQQQTIIVLPDALRKTVAATAKDTSSSSSEPKPPAKEKTFPVTFPMNSAGAIVGAGGGGGGGGGGGEFEMPAISK